MLMLTIDSVDAIIPTLLVSAELNKPKFSPLYLSIFQSNVLAYNFSFFPWTVRTWNLLSTKVAGAPTLELFKSDALLAIRSIRVLSHLRRLY